MTGSASRLRQALDRQAIEEVLLRYCRGVDRLDRALLESTYWPDGHDDHVFLKGSPAAFFDYVMEYLRPMKTQHFMGNFLIDFDSDTFARCESYVLAYHRVKTPFAAEELVAGARYLDRFEKRGSEWRILSRIVCIDYSRRTAATEMTRYQSIRHKGGRYPDDPVYYLRASERRGSAPTLRD